MPLLSPAKLLVILVVALVVLGPDKLPKVAKQIGSLWHDFRLFRQRLESDVRGSFPDLPSTDTITRAVRSPLSFLDNLADAHSADARSADSHSADSHSAENGVPSNPVNGNESQGMEVQAMEEMPDIPGVVINEPGAIIHQVRSHGGIVPHDPGLN